MLRICRSNAVEVLLDRLACRISGEPLSSPLLQEIVVTPSPAMARWVNLGLSHRHGVAANYWYPLPASFIWSLSRDLLGDLPERDPLDIEAMAWKIYSILPAMRDNPAFGSLAHYLQGDGSGLKRWQLSHRIADVFDRYQLYRPDLIRNWGDGTDDHWQARLWRRLAEAVDQHRVSTIDRLLAHLDRAGAATGLPERINLFAVSSLPPLFVQVLLALARHTQLDLYLHSPTDQFWADLISQRSLARQRLDRPEEAELWEVGNDLLASWGRQGQALQDLLLDHELPMDEEDTFVEPSGKTLLERLQQDIFTLAPAPEEQDWAEIAFDGSLQVHVCHSPQRECQVLHDRLLGMLDDDSGLRPEDILVVIPEISLYAPYIEAVFRQDAEATRPFIPWNLSDISVQDEHPLIRVFLQLLELPSSRFSQSEILSYLEVPELARRFGLDSEAAEQIREWLAQANVRWGLGGEHKAQLGLPKIEENTWAQAGRRLFGGYALADDASFEDIAPVSGVEGAKSEALGQFWRLLSRLETYRERLREPRQANDWEGCLGHLLNDFFGEYEDEEGRLQKIRDAVSDLATQACEVEDPISLALVQRWLRERLGTQTGRGRYFSGGVSFCGMRPMRSLPFKVICLLGMHDQAFPRRDRPAEFDLMRSTWRPGDPRKADEDRYLFLETLLCARKTLYISYVGRDIRKNSERQPSVLVRELLDYIDQRYRTTGDSEDGSPSKGLTSVHPLQPFSPRNYEGKTPGYDDLWCDVANAVTYRIPPDGETLDWTAERLPDAPPRMREVDLTQLLRFVRHPVRYFVNTRLKIYLREAEPEEDEELFGLDGLRAFQLKARLLADYLKGQPSPVERLRAEGALPHGPFAELTLQKETHKVLSLQNRLKDWRGQQPTQILVDLDFNGDGAGTTRLTGQIKGIYPNLGLLRYRPSSLKGPNILELWIEHLAWCAGVGEGERSSMLYAQSEGFAFMNALSPQEARDHLARYLGWYWEGIHRPLPVFPRSSYAYLNASRKGGRSDPDKAARHGWEGNDYNDIPGDKDDPYIQLVVRGLHGDPLNHTEFKDLADEFYESALSNGVSL